MNTPGLFRLLKLSNVEGDTSMMWCKTRVHEITFFKREVVLHIKGEEEIKESIFTKRILKTLWTWICVSNVRDGVTSTITLTGEIENQT